MAICFHRIGYVNRRSGRSSALACGYITATRQTDARTGVTRDYRNKSEHVTHTGHIAPDDAPIWAHSYEVWNKLELHVDQVCEKLYRRPETIEHAKKTARVSQTHIFALPIELSSEDYHDLAKRFIEEHFKAEKLVASYGIHEDEGNPHLHIQNALHQIDENGFHDTKYRVLYEKETAKKWRYSFAEICNEQLQERGFDARVDPRSYEERDLDLEPQIHEGWYARKLAEQGEYARVVEANKEIRETNKEKILLNTSIVLKELSQTHATFSAFEALAHVQKRMSDDPIHAAFVYEQVLKEAVIVGQNLEGEERYATADYIEREATALKNAKLLLTSHHKLSILPRLVQRTLDELINSTSQTNPFTLNDEQQNAIKNLCDSSQLSVLVGRAGTGKTSSLKPIVDLHKQAGFNVIGMALAAEAARHLGDDAGIESFTIAAMEQRWKSIDRCREALLNDTLDLKTRYELQSKRKRLESFDIQHNTLVLVDEAGMVGTESMHRILKRIVDTGAKAIFIGDDRQFKAIAAGDIFRKMVDEARVNTRLSTLTFVVRQTESWMRNASEALSEFDAFRALEAYHQKGHIHPISTKEDLALHIAERYVDNVITHKNSNGLVITFTNEDCTLLNAEIRSVLQIKGKINPINHQINGRSYAVNDQIIFLQNQPKKAVNQKHEPILIAQKTGFTPKSFRIKNGTKGSITQIIPIYDESKKQNTHHAPRPIDYRLIVTIEQNGTTYEANFLNSEYNHFQHGYAITLYKAQGQTVDWSMVYATKHMDSIASYVAMTRHRKQLDIYYTLQEFPTFQSLCQTLNRLHTKDLAADYGLIQEHSTITDIVQSYFHIGKEMTLALKSGDTNTYNDFKEERMIFAREILAHFEDYGHVILQSGLTKANLEISAGLRPRTLSQLEEKLLITLEQYIEVALECRTLWHTIRSTHPGVYAKDHPHYTAFQEKQLERGSLAEVLYAHAPITRTFSRELYAGTGYGFSTIQKQALAFEKNQLSDEKMKHLSLDDQARINLYKQADQYQRLSRQLYQDHCEIDKPLNKARHEKGRVLFKTLVSKDHIVEKDKIDILTGGLCHALVQNSHDLKKLVRTLRRVGIECNTESLKQHAKRYEHLLLIHTALHKDIPYEKELHTILKEYPSLNLHHENSLAHLNASKTLLAQYHAAQALNDLMEVEKKTGQKAITKAIILKTFGFEGLKEIYAAARHADRLEVNPVFVKENLQQEIYHLMAYSDVCAKANTVWGRVKTEADQKDIPYSHTSSYVPYQHACMERDCLTYTLRTKTSLTRLKQANALLKTNHLSLRLDRIEQEAFEGSLHHACLTLKNRTAEKSQYINATETLVTALALDETRLKTHNIMRMHEVTHLTLQQHQISVASDAFAHHKEVIEGYVQAVNGYKSAFRIFLSQHGHEWTQLKANHKEALAVKKAEYLRNKAAFHLRGLIQEHGTTTAFQHLLEPLKTTKDQLLHQGDCHESLTLAKAFKACTDTPQKAELGYQLLERFVLETGTHGNRSVSYALREENLTLKDLSNKVQSSIHLNASNALNHQLFDYKQTVIAFGTSYHILMEEFEKAKQQKVHNGNSKEPTVFISRMSTYSDFWEKRMQLSEKAYELIHSTEDVSNFVSASILHKMGGYAHIHETYLLLKGYLAAKERRDPIAPHIAAEILDIMDFEEHEAQTNAKTPLAYGIRPALYHFEIDSNQLKRDGTALHNPHPFRARDIRYLFDKNVKPPAEITQVSQSTTRHNETPDKASDKFMKSSVTTQSDRQYASVETTVIGTHDQLKKQQHKRPEIAPTEFKAFTKQVKEHLTHNIESVAVSLLGEPKEKARNGIWKWAGGVRLHTRSSSRVPRGTFKVYAEGTENMDVFAMIKRTHNVSSHWDAVQIGAALCGLSFKPFDHTQPKTQQPKTIPLTVTVKDQQAPKEEWTPIFPIPRDREYVNIQNHKGLSFILDQAGKETMRFAYRDSANRLLGYVVRFEDEQGKKQTLPLTYCSNNTGKAAWKWKGFGDKTPLYGLDRLAQHPDKPVLMVEGEKAADAAQKQFPHLVVMSWVGGSAGVHKIDLNPLHGKTMIMWPDNDEPGFKAAHTLQERFEEHAKDENCPNTFAIIDIPRDQLPQKWDLADELPENLTAKDLHAHIGQALHIIQKNITTFHIEQEKKTTLHKTNQVYEKIFTYNEITQCATKEGLTFLTDEIKHIPLILHNANETYKELTEWHTIHGEKPDFEKDKRQAMLTGLYTAWAQDKEQKHGSNQTCEKAEQIGALAGRLHSEQLNKNEPHAVLWKAEKAVENFENQVKAHQQNQLHKESISAHIESEIWHASHQCQSLTSKAMPLDLAKEIGKRLQETYHHCTQTQQSKSHEIRSVIKHMVKQKAQCHQINAVLHDEAVTIHTQHKTYKQLCIQQHHEQMKHIEREHAKQQHNSRGMEL